MKVFKPQSWWQATQKLEREAYAKGIRNATASRPNVANSIDAINRLREAARRALHTYGLEVTKEPSTPFPQWAKDALDVAKLVEHSTMEIQK